MRAYNVLMAAATELHTHYASRVFDPVMLGTDERRWEFSPRDLETLILAEADIVVVSSHPLMKPWAPAA
jgi:hypothetical protein